MVAVPASDIDVAAVLDTIESRSFEINGLSDRAYDAIVATGEEIQPWPIFMDEWRDPDRHRNPGLIRSIRADARELRSFGDRGEIPSPTAANGDP